MWRTSHTRKPHDMVLDQSSHDIFWMAQFVISGCGTDPAPGHIHGSHNHMGLLDLEPGMIQSPMPRSDQILVVFQPRKKKWLIDS